MVIAIFCMFDISCDSLFLFSKKLLHIFYDTVLTKQFKYSFTCFTFSYIQIQPININFDFIFKVCNRDKFLLTWNIAAQPAVIGSSPYPPQKHMIGRFIPLKFIQIIFQQMCCNQKLSPCLFHHLRYRSI